MADRPDHDLATELERSQNSYIAKMSDGHNSIIVRSKDDELAECYRLMGAAAARLRQLTDELKNRDAILDGIATSVESLTAERDEYRRQLDTLRNAIGDPDELRWHRWHCEATGSGDDLRELLVRIADVVDALAAVDDPEEGR